MFIANNKKVKFDGARCPFRHFASPRWSPLRMLTKVVSFFIFFKSFQKKFKALLPKMTKIASRGSCLKSLPKFQRMVSGCSCLFKVVWIPLVLPKFLRAKKANFSYTGKLHKTEMKSAPRGLANGREQRLATSWLRSFEVTVKPGQPQ